MFCIKWRSFTLKCLYKVNNIKELVINFKKKSYAFYYELYENAKKIKLHEKGIIEIEKLIERKSLAETYLFII